MSSADWRVRRAESADLDGLVETRVALFRELERTPSEADAPAFRAACRAGLAAALESGGAAWIAEGDGAIRGAVILLVFPRIPSPRLLAAAEGYLLNVYVDPAWRRRGAARALVAAALEEARARRLARVRLHATREGAPLYAAYGFETRDNEMELVL